MAEAARPALDAWVVEYAHNTLRTTAWNRVPPSAQRSAWPPRPPRGRRPVAPATPPVLGLPGRCPRRCLSRVLGHAHCFNESGRCQHGQGAVQGGGRGSPVEGGVGVLLSSTVGRFVLHGDADRHLPRSTTRPDSTATAVVDPYTTWGSSPPLCASAPARLRSAPPLSSLADA